MPEDTTPNPFPRLTEDIKDLRKYAIFSSVEDIFDDLEDYRALLRKADEVLAFYGFGFYYREQACCSDVGCSDTKIPILKDRGQKARDFRAQLPDELRGKGA